LSAQADPLSLGEKLLLALRFGLSFLLLNKIVTSAKVERARAGGGAAAPFCCIESNEQMLRTD
jgi:hypothetical protein